MDPEYYSKLKILFAKYDSDNDGNISLEELNELIEDADEETWKSKDVNRDGIIDYHGKHLDFVDLYNLYLPNFNFQFQNFWWWYSMLKQNSKNGQILWKNRKEGKPVFLKLFYENLLPGFLFLPKLKKIENKRGSILFNVNVFSESVNFIFLKNYPGVKTEEHRQFLVR